MAPQKIEMGKIIMEKETYEKHNCCCHSAKNLADNNAKTHCHCENKDHEKGHCCNSAKSCCDNIKDISELESANMNDKYLRLAAELENTRRRATLDIESAARNRAMSLANKFLPLIDAIDAAAIHAPNDEGIRALALAAESVLAKCDIIKIESVGKQLNPMLHNAIQVIDVPLSDEPCAIKHTPNTIVSEMQSGYMFGDTVLRPAMVVVGK